MYYYTGVGSRKTPQNVLKLMEAVARKMASFNYTLRTGDADGADKAFRDAAYEATIYTPNWINPKNNDPIIPDPEVYKAAHATTEAMRIAGRFHPAWNAVRKDGKTPVVSDFAKRLHGRNAFQVLGPNLNEPSMYCICWTSDGCQSHATRTIATGGTGTAISISEAYGVPVINLALPEQFKVWSEWIKIRGNND